MKRLIGITVEQARELLGKNSELDTIIKANFTEEELNPKPKLPKSWVELKTVEGYFIKEHSNIVPGYPCSTIENNKNVFATEKQAKSALAMAQLSQLMKVYNDGWVADWNNEDQIKYVIERLNNSIRSNDYCVSYYFLSFKTAELRDEFLKNFELLIKEYFEL